MGAPFVLRSSAARLIAFRIPGCLRIVLKWPPRPEPGRQNCGLSACRSAIQASFGPVARTATLAAKLRTWPDLCQENPRSMTIRAGRAKTQWQIWPAFCPPPRARPTPEPFGSRRGPPAAPLQQRAQTPPRPTLFLLQISSGEAAQQPGGRQPPPFFFHPYTLPRPSHQRRGLSTAQV